MLIYLCVGFFPTFGGIVLLLLLRGGHKMEPVFSRLFNDTLQYRLSAARCHPVTRFTIYIKTMVWCLFVTGLGAKMAWLFTDCS